MRWHQICCQLLVYGVLYRNNLKSKSNHVIVIIVPSTSVKKKINVLTFFQSIVNHFCSSFKIKSEFPVAGLLFLKIIEV